MATHPLENAWVLWEHKHIEKGHGDDDWSNSMKPICEFTTVEEFWKYWAFIPRPSEVFCGPDGKRDIDGRVIEAFSIFKKGISPDYYDIINREGSELTCRKNFSSEVLDTHWENLVLSLIGETIDEDNQVCGARVVDKTTKGRPMYRLELWIRSKAQDVADKLRGRLLNSLVEGEGAAAEKARRQLPEFIVKPH